MKWTSGLHIWVLLFSLGAGASPIEPTEADFERWAESWDRLIPAGTYDFIPENVSFDLMFDPTFQKKLDEAGLVLNPSLEGQQIELAGFMVPIETQGQTVSQFLLVPEAGQCIHVPAPPMNQTLLVDASNNPTELRDLYQAVVVRGRLSVGKQQFELADSGYTLVDVQVESLALDESMIPVAPDADGDR
jgi:uncharacterized protein